MGPLQNQSDPDLRAGPLRSFKPETVDRYLQPVLWKRLAGFAEDHGLALYLSKPWGAARAVSRTQLHQKSSVEKPSG